MSSGVPTLLEIVANVNKNDPHFFHRDTMKYFGQTLSMFRVIVSKSGRVFIYAPGGTAPFTFCEYVDNSLEEVDFMPQTEEDIKAYASIV